jgi:hypothetical protein
VFTYADSVLPKTLVCRTPETPHHTDKSHARNKLRQLTNGGGSPTNPGQGLLRALAWLTEVVGIGGPVNQEGCALGLPDRVEPTDSDVCVREGLGGVGDLGQDLAGVSAPEHGQLVHCPVPAQWKELKIAAISKLDLPHREGSVWCLIWVLSPVPLVIRAVCV